MDSGLYGNRLNCFRYVLVTYKTCDCVAVQTPPKEMFVFCGSLALGYIKKNSTRTLSFDSLSSLRTRDSCESVNFVVKIGWGYG